MDCNSATRLSNSRSACRRTVFRLSSTTNILPFSAHRSARIPFVAMRRDPPFPGPFVSNACALISTGKFIVFAQIVLWNNWMAKCRAGHRRPPCSLRPRDKPETFGPHDRFQETKRLLAAGLFRFDGQPDVQAGRATCRISAGRLVGEEGVEPSIPHGQRILSPPCMPFHHSPEKKPVATGVVFRRNASKKSWRRHPESNREYKVLQTFALPFGYTASMIGIVTGPSEKVNPTFRVDFYLRR